MPRNLDATLAAHLGDPVIGPAIFAELSFKSGKERVWSGVGDFVGPEGNTFQGVGNFGGIGAIGEGTEVKAEGTTVTLSGIGDSLFDIPPLTPTPPAPPFTPPAGQSVAWSYAEFHPGPATHWSIPPTIWNAFLGLSGTGGGTQTTGFIAVQNGDSLDTPNGGQVSWGGFALPPEIPADATITGVYPVVTISGLSVGGSMGVGYTGGSLTLAIGTQVGVNLGALSGQSIEASIFNSTPGAASLSINISFVGMAVYYTGAPKTKLTLLNEALNDIWLGAPARIWFGLLRNGALLGVPYLIFAGTVDKPSVHIGLPTLSITLALENRLVNLQRANQRRYTAADQKLYYPTDMAFNWVESLNDIALRWGS